MSLQVASSTKRLEDKAISAFRENLPTKEARRHFERYVREVKLEREAPGNFYVFEVEGKLHIRCGRISHGSIGHYYSQMMQAHWRTLNSRHEAFLAKLPHPFSGPSTFSWTERDGTKPLSVAASGKLSQGTCVLEALRPASLELLDSERQNIHGTLLEFWETNGARRAISVNRGGPGKQEALDFLLSLNLTLSRAESPSPPHHSRFPK